MDLAAPTIALVCALVFVAGFLDAIAGGGGLISLPAYFAVGLPPHAALATNKFSSVLGTLTATARYALSGKLRWRVGLAAALGAAAGAAAGARAVLWLAPATVHTVVLLLIPAALVILLLRDRLVRPGAAPDLAGRPALLRAAAIGLVVGAWDGFFGPGTGTFLTIAFATWLGLDLLTAAGNARLANLASNAGSLVVFLASGAVLFPLALYAGAAGIAGNLLGARLALRRGERVVKPFLVGVLVLLLAEVLRRRFLA
jgi:hypothetical protein